MVVFWARFLDQTNETRRDIRVGAFLWLVDGAYAMLVAEKTCTVEFIDI